MKYCRKCSFSKLIIENEGNFNECYHLYCTAAQRHCGQVTFERDNVPFLLAPDWCPRDKLDNGIPAHYKDPTPLVLPIVY